MPKGKSKKLEFAQKLALNQWLIAPTSTPLN